MRKIFISILLVFGISLVGCNVSEEDVEDIVDDELGDTDETEDEAEEAETEEGNDDPTSSENDGKDNNNITLNTGDSETVDRIIEGMDEEVEVVNYDIEEYGISYQLDETFDEPEVNGNQITYSNQDGKYKVEFEVIESTNLDEAVSNLQERFSTEDYEEEGELEDTPSGENELKGKMQYYGYPMEGFYAYEFDDHVLVITYEYPVEGGDGMGPLLESLRKSIKVD